uniref:Bestrophin homolog n=1 Tax=Acrobeloides nanus TaxID=290746 RepID=A0A914EAZ5_9BILA
MPIQWALMLVNDLKKQGKLEDGSMITSVPVPLAYPQTVALAIRFYFLISVVSRQYLIHPTLNHPNPVDFYIPFMTMFQFIFYVGWLKVAEALLNPLGEDDDDFESNYIIDRNISIGLSIVDDAYGQLPKQMPDTFKVHKKPLYTEESAKVPINPLIGSAAQKK